MGDGAADVEVRAEGVAASIGDEIVSGQGANIAATAGLALLWETEEAMRQLLSLRCLLGGTGR